MRKPAFVLGLGAILCALLGAGLSSAAFDPKLIGKGVKVGVNIANVANHPDDPESRRGYTIGALANYPLIKNVDLQIELLFTGKGYRIPDTTIVDSLGDSIGTAEWTAMVTYIEIPITAKLMVPVKGKVKPYLQLGGFAAQAISKKQRRSTTGVVYEITLENVKTTDLGFTLGAGLDVKAGRGKVFIEGRYDYSNISLMKYTKYRSRVWSFQAGYWW